MTMLQPAVGWLRVRHSGASALRVAAVSAWLGVVTAISASATPVAPATEQALRRVVAQAAAQGFAGEVLVADREHVWFERAVGLAQADPPRPHRVGDLWRWGSVSKQVTAVLVMQQVDAGRLALDDTLARVWPTFAAPRAGTLTVRQLLTHTSGLPDPGATAPAADGMPAFYRRRTADLQADALRLCAGTPRAEPGAGFAYNDCDTLVLAGLLAHLTGQPFERLLAQRLSQPLALGSLQLARGEGRARAQARDAAGQPVPQPRLATYGAAGAMEGTARDLLAFDRALLAGRLLSAGARQVLWTGEPRWGYAAPGAWAFPAPLAGCAGPVDLVERRGIVGGIQARNLIAPASGVSVIVFTNQAELDFGEIWQGRGLSHDLLAAALCTKPWRR
jgi:CubicO group peptidase (beta-lactamase class C family)